MAWPHSQDYNEAIQNPGTSFSDAELKQGQVVTNALGLPQPCSGNFADVYPFNCPNNKWAIKCFTREIAGLKERYREISSYLKQTPLPFMVDFTYLEQGIRVRGEWFPILKMRWVEGFTLNEFVKKNLDKPQLLDVLSQIWVKLAGKLREARLAHCDLQHGNVLLVPGSKATSLAVKLVDYDGMCVPALTMLKSAEVGHPNFQHPQRAKEEIYSLDVDRFSHLVIYTALRSLIVGGRSLWEKHDNGDNLLFRHGDFDAPDTSKVFAEVSGLDDPAVKRLVSALKDACKKPLDKTPLLEEIVPKLPKKTIAPAPKQRKAVQEVAEEETVVEEAVEEEDVFADATSDRPRRRKKKSMTPALVLGIAIGAVLAMAGGAAVVLMGKGGKANDDTKVASVDPDARPEPIQTPRQIIQPSPTNVTPPPPVVIPQPTTPRPIPTTPRPIPVVVKKPKEPTLPSDPTAVDAINEVIGKLQVRKGQAQDRAAQDRIGEAIAILAKMRDEPSAALPAEAETEITPELLKKKFRGKAVHNSKTGLLTLVYDFTNRDQLGDFDLQGNKPAVVKGGLNLEAGEVIQHGVVWKTVTINAKCRNKGAGEYIKLTGGVRFHVYGNTTALVVPQPSGKPYEAVESHLAAGPTWTVEIKVLENRAALKIGDINIGWAAKQPAAGNVELHAGTKGNFFMNLVLEGKVDEQWFKTFFAAQ